MGALDATAAPIANQHEPGARTLAQELLLVPNLLSLMRVLAVPVFAWALVTGRAGLALALFLGAACTDVLDGFLARMLRLKTRLGAVLDPLADKLLTLVALVLLVVTGELPGWLLGVVILRDACIAGAFAVLRVRHIVAPVEPSRFGKYATLMLFATTTLALVRAATTGSRLDGWVAATGLLAAQCVVATTVQYFTRWLTLLRRHSP